jgi:hypothetical protein
MSPSADHVCGPDCRYRTLYEGSQTSLSDMAARQAEALSAHTALRRRIVENMKRNHPDAFASAERAMGMRMSDVEDDVLVTYLDALTERRGQVEVVAHDGIDRLRSVLLRAGIPVPDSTDLIAWVPAIERHLDRLGGRPPARRAQPVDPATPGGASGLAGRAAAAAVISAPLVPTDPAPVESGGADGGGHAEESPEGDDGAPDGGDAEIEALLAELDSSTNLFAETATGGGEDDLDDLFDAPQAEPAAEVDAAVDDGLDDLFGGPATSTPSDPADADSWTGAAPAADDDLDDLFAAPVATPTSAAPPPAAPAAADGLGDLFDAPRPAAELQEDDGLDDLFGGVEGGPDSATSGPQGDDGLDDLFDTAPAAPEVPDSAASDDLDDLFDAPTPTSEPTSGPTAGDGGLDDLFDAPAPDTAAPAADDLSDLFDAPPAVPATPETGAADTAAPAADDDLDDLFGGPAPAEPTTVLGDLFAEQTSPAAAEPAPPAASPEAERSTPSAAASAVAAAGGTAALFDDPMRPQLMPTRRGRKRGNRKTPRTRAVSANRDTPESPGATAEPVELEAASRNAILAAVAIPRPVFVVDLEAVAGGRAAVEAWEDEMRGLKTKAPVRLIGGKPRHRALGALVIPHGELRDASTEFTHSWWADCMDSYTGAKLYELGVLLRRVGSQVASAAFTPETAVLRLNTPRGLVGIVVATGTTLADGGATRVEIADELSKLARERLSLIAVLATTADQSDADNICELVPAEAEAGAWPATTPIVFAHSWEWDDSAGTVMKLLHGG